MSVKEVYSIRITKNDDEIRDYLEQFPVHKQNKALKSLLKYGAERLQEDYASNKAIQSLNETIKAIQETQTEQLEEIKSLITNMKISNVNNATEEDDSTFDVEKTKKSMEEALSMLMG